MLLEINAIDIVIMCSLYVSLSLAVITEPLSQTQRRLQTSGTCNNWTSSDSKMPRATAHAAIGHDQHTIWLLGDHSYGSNKRQLVSFNIHDHTFTDLGETALSYDVYGSATYYTQIEEFLWIADPQSDHFNRFNLHTMQTIKCCDQNTYMQTIKCLVHSFGDVVGICVEMFDMTTDYLFAASLIIHNNGLGWISLMFAVCGLAIFFFKYSAYRTLIA
eukprot:220383_1